MFLPVLGVLAGLVLLIFGAHFLVDGGAGIAKRIGVSGHIIGITLVAAATSLPELATSATASFQGHPGLAIGNVVGSNAFNILLIIGISGAIEPIRMGGLLNPGVIPGMILITVLGILLSRRRMGDLQGWMLLLAYVLFFVLLMPFAW